MLRLNGKFFSFIEYVYRVDQQLQLLTLLVKRSHIPSITVFGHMMDLKWMKRAFLVLPQAATMLTKTWFTKHLESKFFKTHGKDSIAAYLLMDKLGLVKVTLW